MFFYPFVFLGTGSRPPGEKGWHLATRLKERTRAINRGREQRASAIYWEHVGEKRQQLPNKGEIRTWYKRIKTNSALTTNAVTVFTINWIDLSREGFSSLFPAARQDFFAPHGWHSRPKAVLVFSFSPTRLICALHYCSKFSPVKYPLCPTRPKKMVNINTKNATIDIKRKRSLWQDEKET